MIPTVTVILAVLAFILFWTILLNFIAYVSGWWSLAAHYGTTTRFEGKRRRFRSLQIGSANMGGCVTIGTNAEGLYLAINFPFRPGFPPLFVPWADFEAKLVKHWMWNILEVRFRKTPRVVLRFRESLGKQIAEDANQSWEVKRDGSD